MAPKVSPRHMLPRMFDRLLDAYGPQHWWPGETQTEVVVGAILTQNTAWANVERAIANLKDAGCLRWHRLAKMRRARLAALIRPSGYYNIKAGRLKSFVDALVRDHSASLEVMIDGPLEAARRRLLAIRGIGPETADSILLYAAGRPTFVVDAYTKRILRRHHLMPQRDDYDTVRAMFQAHLPPDVQLYNEYHALIVRVGKEHCRARARCEGCPLADWPHDESR